METDDLAANTAQLWPTVLGAHATTIYDNSGIGEHAIRDKCFSVALDPFSVRAMATACTV